MTAVEVASVDYSIAERRRYKRERVVLMGRQFEPADGRETHCKVVDISPGGARVLSDVVPPLGTRIVVYIDEFGRFEGSVARAEQSAFGVQFNCSEYKRERIAEQITLYMNGGSLDKSALRRHERTPTKSMTRFTRANGDVVNCEVVDLSLSGVSLATEIRPPVGELVLIGQMAGRIARHHGTGIGIEFLSQHSAVVEPMRSKLFVSG